MSLRIMSGFIQDTINQATSSTLGVITTTTTNNNNSNNVTIDSKIILSDLMDIVKECQTRYGGKTELATENDMRILKLCNTWEHALSHGLKVNSSILKNMTDIMSGQSLEPPTFWDFAYQHLTAHEKERFSTLRHVWTDRGKSRALIRAALNERAMERYILIWLNDLNITNRYEKWSFMRDVEAINLLPSIAAGLSSILFAISVDATELNVSLQCTNNINNESRPEPVIAAPIPSTSQIRKVAATKRQIISFDDNNNNNTTNNFQQSFSISPATTLSSSMPKSLSSMCLKYEDDVQNRNVDNNKYSVRGIRSSTEYQTKTLLLKDTRKISNDESIYGDQESPMSIKLFSDITNYDTIVTDTPPQSDSGIMEIYANDDLNSSSSTANSSSSSIPSISKRNSLHSSNNSLKSTEDSSLLHKKLCETEERCTMLEARVAELSLENHRLRGLNNTSRHSFNYFTVSVPRVILQRTNTRKYYAYEIHIIPTHGGDEWTVLRRYNDFYKLHKKLQKDSVAVKTLDFPPKKNFGNMDAHFVDQRRQRLQVYLRHLIAVLPEVASCTTRSQLEQVFQFFK